MEFVLKNNRKIQLLESICCLVIVAFVAVFAFLYKEKIENFAATGYLGVFIACIAATSTILLPAPGILVVIQYSQLLNPAVVVLIGSGGTALGEMVGYMLGRSSSTIAQINTEGRMFHFFKRHPKMMTFLFAVIPFPVFDIVGICAGIIKMNPISFWLSCMCGKSIKMGMYVALYSYATKYIQVLLDGLVL